MRAVEEILTAAKRRRKRQKSKEKEREENKDNVERLFSIIQ